MCHMVSTYSEGEVIDGHCYHSAEINGLALHAVFSDITPAGKLESWGTSLHFCALYSTYADLGG